MYWSIACIGSYICVCVSMCVTVCMCSLCTLVCVRGCMCSTTTTNEVNQIIINYLFTPWALSTPVRDRLHCTYVTFIWQFRIVTCHISNTIGICKSMHKLIIGRTEL